VDSGVGIAVRERRVGAAEIDGAAVGGSTLTGAVALMPLTEVIVRSAKKELGGLLTLVVWLSEGRKQLEGEEPQLDAEADLTSARSAL